jgi:hypothetical protein
MVENKTKLTDASVQAYVTGNTAASNNPFKPEPLRGSG